MTKDELIKAIEKIKGVHHVYAPSPPRTDKKTGLEVLKVTVYYDEGSSNMAKLVGAKVYNNADITMTGEIANNFFGVHSTSFIN